MWTWNWWCKSLYPSVYYVWGSMEKCQEHSFLRLFVPMVELSSFSGPFVPGNESCMEHSFPGPFVAGDLLHVSKFWILWSGGVMHGTWSSIQKKLSYVHRQWEVTSYLSVQLMWSHIVQCPDSQISWDHSYRWVVLVLSCTLDPQPCKLHPGLGFLRRNRGTFGTVLPNLKRLHILRYFVLHWSMQHPFGILIWPRTVICWRSYNGDLQGF